MDAYGKYSLVDFYVMTLMLCAFHFDMQLAQDDLEVILYVVPNWGFMGFLLATLISLGLGHISVAFLRFDQQPEDARVILEASRKDTQYLGEHIFEMKAETVSRLRLSGAPAPGREGSQSRARDNNDYKMEGIEANNGNFTMALTSRGQQFVLCAHVLLLITIAYGSYATSFTFSFQGLTGWLLGDAADVDYSMISVGTSVTEASGTPDSLSIRWMQACYFVFSLAMPLACVFLSAVMWSGPALTLSHHKSLVVMMEVMYAWSALDVFCISIFAAITEISQFAAFMVGDKCDGLNKILEAYLDPELHGNDVCFDVITTLCPQSPVLFLSALLFVFVVVPSLSFGEAALHARIAEGKQKASKSGKAPLQGQVVYRTVSYAETRQRLHDEAAAAPFDKGREGNGNNAGTVGSSNPLLAAPDNEIYSQDEPLEPKDCGGSGHTSSEIVTKGMARSVYENCTYYMGGCYRYCADSILCLMWRSDLIIVASTHNNSRKLSSK